MVEDILSDADPVAEAPTEIATRARQGLTPLEPVVGLAAGALKPEHASTDHRWLFAAIAVVLLGMAILGFAIKWFLTLRPASVNKPLAPAVIAPFPQVPPVTSLVPAAQEIPPLPVPLPSTSVDSDRDGLSDTQETEHGTDVFLPDTDSDGLTDYDEVKVFGTDPKNPDSDGDGFRDGEEVASGYNPKGAGKLLDLEGALKKSNE